MKTRQQAISWVLGGIFIANIVVTLMKGVVGILSNTLSMVADALHSTMDSSSNIIGLISVYYAYKPPDEEHPFGHRKFEVIAGFAISVFLMFTCFEILSSAIERFLAPQIPVITPLTYVVMIITVIVNFGVYRYEYGQGIKLKSLLLKSDALHTKSDIYVSVTVLIGLFISGAGFYLIDPILTMVVVVFIGREAIVIMKQNMDTLVDSAPVAQEQIASLAEEVPGVIDAHKIRSRGISDEIYIDMHIVVDPTITVFVGHEIATQVQRTILKKMPEIKDVHVHVEPQGIDS